MNDHPINPIPAAPPADGMSLGETVAAFSPVFECSHSGLHSAVLLRYRLWGKSIEFAEEAARVYMNGYRCMDPGDETLRERIELVIGDIERLSAAMPAPADVVDILPGS